MGPESSPLRNFAAESAGGMLRPSVGKRGGDPNAYEVEDTPLIKRTKHKNNSIDDAWAEHGTSTFQKELFVGVSEAELYSYGKVGSPLLRMQVALDIVAKV